MTFREKIDKIQSVSGLKIYQIEKKCGFGQGTIQKRYNSGKPLSELYLMTFLKKMNINITWWKTGEGDVLRENSPLYSEEEKVNYNVIEKTNAQRVALDQIEIPVVELKAQAGYLRGYNDPEYMETLPKVAVSKEFERGGNFICWRIEGDSMDDGTKRSILHNDIILTRELDRKHWKSKLFLDIPFVIVHEEGVTCKQIINHDVENGIITCHSWNNGPDYEDFTLNLQDVRQLWYLRRLVERKMIF